MTSAEASYGQIRTPLNQVALDNYLVEHVPDFTAPSTIQQFTFGQSNPTYFVTSASGERYVLRKKPAGQLVSMTHSVEREYRIMDCIGKTGKIPVPKVVVLCLDEGVLGSAFYLMEYLEGRIFNDMTMPEITSREERTACWMSIVQVLADIHKLKPSEIGLGDYGSTKPFYPRQIRSFTRISNAQSSVVDPTSGLPIGEIPNFDRLVDYYSRTLDSDGPWEGRIVHGDYKANNLMFHPTEPRLIGVLDWELSTLGNPLSDLASLLLAFYVPKDPNGSSGGDSVAALRDIPDTDLPIPGAVTLSKAYCAAVGRSFPVPNWSAVVSFSFFRLSVIFQGIAARSAQGRASSANAEGYAEALKPLARLAMEAAEHGVDLQRKL